MTSSGVFLVGLCFVSFFYRKHKTSRKLILLTKVHVCVDPNTSSGYKIKRLEKWHFCQNFWVKITNYLLNKNAFKTYKIKFKDIRKCFSYMVSYSCIFITRLIDMQNDNVTMNVIFRGGVTVGVSFKTFPFDFIYIKLNRIVLMFPTLSIFPHTPPPHKRNFPPQHFWILDSDWSAGVD